MGSGLRRTAFDQASYTYWTGKYGLVNVKDFGAVGDGVHDDTQAIQAAINSLPSGGTVYLPQGSYVISSALTITQSGLTLRGQNIVSTSLQLVGNINGIEVLGPVTGTTIQTLFINGDSGATSGAGIYLDSSGNSVYTTLIENVWFQTYDGVRLYNTNTTSLLHCRMNCGHYGLYCGDGCRIVRFANAEVGGGFAGVFLDGNSQSIKLLQLEIFTSTYGVALDAANGGSGASYVYMYDVECNPEGVLVSDPIYFYINNAGEVHLTECWADGGPQSIQINGGTVTILGGRYGDGNSPIIGINGGNSNTIVGADIAGSPNGTGIGITGGGNIRITDCIFGLFGSALNYAVTVADTYTGAYSVSAGGTTGNIVIANCSMGETAYQKGNGYAINCAPNLVYIYDTYGALYGKITPPASPLVSGTVYRNTSPVPIVIYQPAYASTSGTAGSVAVALGSGSSPSTLFTQYVDGSTTSSLPNVIQLRVNPGWYYSFTTSGATLLDANIQGS